MSEKKLITWESFKENCLAYNAPRKLRKCYYKDCECSQCNCERWQALPKPTLADVTGNRALDSMTEEEAREYEKKFVSIKYHGATLATRIRVIKQNIACDDISIRMTKWFLEKGFNVFEVGK